MKKAFFILVAISGWSWGEQVQITSPLPLPITGNITASFSPPAVTTVTYNGVTQPVQVLNSTVGVVGSISFTPPATTTVTFNGTPQPTYVINPTTTSITGTVPVSGTFFQTVQPVTFTNLSTTTVIASTVGITGSISNTTFGSTQGTTPWVIGNSTTAVNVLGTVPVSGFPAIQQVYDNRPATMTVIASTVGINGTVPVSGTFFQSLQQVYDNRPATMTVVGSTIGINGTVPTTVSNSTTAVVNAAGTTLAVTGAFNLGQSTFGVVNGGSVFQIGNSTIGVVGTFAIGPSTFGMVNGGSVFQVGNSTLAVVFPSAQSITGTVSATQGTTPWVIGNSTTDVNVLGTVATTVSNSTIGVVGTFSLGQSTFGIVNGGSVFTIGNSTIAISNSLSVTSLSTSTVGSSTGNVVNLNGLVVSSAVIPAPAETDGKTQIQAGTNIGQVLVTGIPFGVTVSSYGTGITTETIRTDTGGGSTSLEGVLFSSGTAPNGYLYLCGCEFSNPTSTATVIIESPTASATNRIPISLTAAPSSPQGIWGTCQNPVWRSAAFSNTYIFASAITVPDPVNFYCLGYYGP